MDVRILTINEMPQAVALARGVFNFCLRNHMQFPQYIASFEAYAEEDNIRSMMEQGKLTLWGIYEMGQLVAMSGMQSEGHITMLYVLPIYQRKGLGKELLLEMRKYARSRYNLLQVTVNAMPAWTASYFQRQRFFVVNPTSDVVPFMYMQAKSIHEISYQQKRIPVGAAVGTVVGGLVVCLIAASAFMVHYLSQIV